MDWMTVGSAYTGETKPTADVRARTVPDRHILTRLKDNDLIESLLECTAIQCPNQMSDEGIIGHGKQETTSACVHPARIGMPPPSPAPQRRRTTFLLAWATARVASPRRLRRPSRSPT